MYIITVSPISRGAFTDQLTYWSPHSFAVGTIISVPFRTKHIQALVQRVEDASDAKMEIKNATFEPKKIESAQEEAKKNRVVRPECLKTAAWASEYFVAHVGSLLSMMIPACAYSTISAAEEAAKPKKAKAAPIKIDTNESGLVSGAISAAAISSLVPPSETLTLQGSTEDRIKTYRSLIREEFARRKSVVVIAPRIIDAEQLFEQLTKGIDGYGILIHSGMSKQKVQSAWNKAISADHPVIVVSTPGFAMIPRDDISVIVIEMESSRLYSTSWAPYVDQRLTIEHYGRAIGARVVLGDTLLRVETLYRREESEIGDLSQAVFRLERVPEPVIVDMNDPMHRDKDGFKLISEELWSMIDYSAKKKERMIIFCSRKGMSPQTVCGDCGKTVMCTRCSAPVVLHQPKAGDRYFLCHHCGEKRSALETCKYCNSWKLVTLGIGIDTIYNDIARKRPDTTLFKLDRESIKKESDGRKIAADFGKHDHAVLLMTETGLPFAPTVPHMAVASLDTLFSLPDFRISERIVHNLIDLSQKSEKYLLIQTRNADSPLLRAITGGGLMEFYRNEIEAREKLSYPPFQVFIKLTIKAPRDRAVEILEHINEELADWNPVTFPAFTATVKNEAVFNSLITLPKHSWPNGGEGAQSSAALRSKLLALPREVSVHVNPESML